MTFSAIAFAFSLIPYTLLLISINPATKNAILPVSLLYVFVALSIVMFCALMPQLLSAIEEIVKNAFIRRPKLQAFIPEYFPAESIRASARFVVALKLLPSSQSCNPRKLRFY